ncbi:hypothetical protein [Paenibacillus ihumii]|uniref:hypothetical protein n=1 Tax=Paenibacillus ihumii TaxID=687436 RepID=UPI0006D806D6|nr:hypothetical protein [Paenibacillus ihumii]
MEMRVIVIIGGFIMLLFAAVLGAVAMNVKKKRSRFSGSSSKVIHLSKKRFSSGRSDLAAPRSQKCSRCNQVKKLVFYSNDWGHVAGLCKECRKEIGDKQELYPI